MGQRAVATVRECKYGAFKSPTDSKLRDTGYCRIARVPHNRRRCLAVCHGGKHGDVIQRKGRKIRSFLAKCDAQSELLDRNLAAESVQVRGRVDKLLGVCRIVEVQREVLGLLVVLPWMSNHYDGFNKSDL